MNIIATLAALMGSRGLWLSHVDAPKRKAEIAETDKLIAQCDQLLEEAETLKKRTVNSHKMHP